MTVQFFNSPPVKNGIKNVFGAIAFSGGLYSLYEMQKTTDKTVLFLQTSIVLNGIASRPGLAICEWVLHQIAAPETLTMIFGLNTIFEINPWHPRHLFNVSVNLIAAVALITVIYSRKAPRTIAALTVFNFFTGRSTLHLANDAWFWAANIKRSGSV
ncbi:MAG TPA: hypothetical protein VHK67_03165 [Rhabdochlamydiaceae bacterium]|jgi:hypothetical protein|nr:hypothetical protein [Rhabdochlamydiaceae bacterium]